MIKKSISLTAEGKKELEKELEELIKGRPAIAEKIATARAFGDLSENEELPAGIRRAGRHQDLPPPAPRSESFYRIYQGIPRCPLPRDAPFVQGVPQAGRARCYPCLQSARLDFYCSCAVLLLYPL